MTYAAGALVRARGREWVVLPESKDDLLMLRPLGGSDAETAGIYLPLETVTPAEFGLPSPEHLGDHTSCRMLRDAVRLGFRSSAGPFRSFAQLAVEPRPYQLVPLLMALKQDPVRLLIADDVGIGKTVEAGLVAKELLARGEAKRLAVLCPPPLVEQWQAELSEKFHIEAEAVLAGTAARLEKHLGTGQSLFDIHPHVVVSIDFIKSDRRRDDFIRACPDLVIVDEAHSCAHDPGSSSTRHQRHLLLRKLAENPERHLLLVTATPHSGKEAAFRSLLALLRSDFAGLPEEADDKQRQALAQHVVQRRRSDLRHFLDADTPFPKREELDETYALTPEYRALFSRVLAFAREKVASADGKRHQRVQWWAALGLLRALASSPAAAAATLRNRAAMADAESPETADALGRLTVLDQEADEGGERLDVVPGSQTAEPDSPAAHELLELAAAADALVGAKDGKLRKLTPILTRLVGEGYRPIVFCRFVQTATYVAEQLRKSLKGVEVIAVTGELAPEERVARIDELAKSDKRLLVATDCLSEGINLQHHFDAIVHYDLAWNPTRHEQREGRVDRYGQPKKTVRVLTYWGEDNQIDGIVLDVLLKKHKQIRTSLGISVPVPSDTNKTIEAIFEGLLLKKAAKGSDQLQLFRDDVIERPVRDNLFKEWEAAEEREKRSRTIYAQYALKVEEVARELAAVRGAIGSHVDVQRFFVTALKKAGAVAAEKDGRVTVELAGTPVAVREALGEEKKLAARFELPVADDEVYLRRTHPVVERLASHVLTAALDTQAGDALAARAGVIETRAVAKRTTLLLTRYRFHILTKRGNEEWPLLAEDCRLVAFRGAAEEGEWLTADEAEALLSAEPSASVTPERARGALDKLIGADAKESLTAIQTRLAEDATERGKDLLDAHRRVRQSARLTGTSQRIEAAGLPDLLGTFVLLPSRA